MVDNCFVIHDSIFDTVAEILFRAPGRSITL